MSGFLSSPYAFPIIISMLNIVIGFGNILCSLMIIRAARMNITNSRALIAAWQAMRDPQLVEGR